jgi:hypothetical protein
MKILTIPDVHGTDHWRSIVSEINNYDKIIFMGDYFDNWTNHWPEQGENFQAIMAFKEMFPNKVITLWGNHDTSYYLGEHCSGYQPHRDIDIVDLIKAARKNLDAIAIFDGVIYAHGGVSALWMKQAGITSPTEINQLFLERVNFFRWVGPSGSGNNDNEGPLWIRPYALSENGVAGYNQVVGHSEFDPLCESGNRLVNFKGIDNWMFLVDSPEHKDFFIVEDGKHPILMERNG